MTPAPFHRRTLAGTVRVEGRGLFTERPAVCTIRPAGRGHGVTLERDGATPIPAMISLLSRTPVHPAFAQIPPRHTALDAHGGQPFYTTEHILAALAGLGITDAAIHLDGPEFPIGDGSARLFTDPILAGGITDLGTPVEPLVITESVRLESPDGRASITAEPADNPLYRYDLDYGPQAPIPPQSAEWHGSPAEFALEIAPARTFSLAAEATQLQALGLFKSFAPRDLLVIGDSGVPMENTWRFAEEPARHKLLDLIGDLALVGMPILGRITALRAGHALNHALARALAGG